MKFGELLAEITSETETYLEEAVVKKGKKFYCMKGGKKDEVLPGTKESGYYSLENASKAMLSVSTESFGKMPFTAKKKRLDRYMKSWKTKNNEKDKKPKKKYGFEQL